MGENKSSIIEELMAKKAEANNKINELKKNTENEEMNLKKWEENVISEREAKTHDLKRNKERRSSEIKTLDERKKEFERAIEAIEKGKPIMDKLKEKLNL